MSLEFRPYHSTSTNTDYMLVKNGNNLELFQEVDGGVMRSVGKKKYITGSQLQKEIPHPFENRGIYKGWGNWDIQGEPKQYIEKNTLGARIQKLITKQGEKFLRYIEAVGKGNYIVELTNDGSQQKLSYKSESGCALFNAEEKSFCEAAKKYEFGTSMENLYKKCIELAKKCKH